MIDFSQAEHPFIKYGEKLGIIIITSDEGFMGGLNTKVINTALSHPRAMEAKLIVIGNRGAAYLKGMGFECKKFPGISSREYFNAVNQLKNYILEESMAGHLGSLILFYPKSCSFMVQKVEQLNILPCHELFKKREKQREAGAGFKKQVKRSKGFKDFFKSMNQDIIVESSLDAMIEYLVEIWMVQKLFEVFEDSKLSELSARAISLEESYYKLLDKQKEFTYQFFRTKHEMIDKEMRDMFSAQVVRNKKIKSRDRSHFLKVGPVPTF